MSEFLGEGSSSGVAEPAGTFVATILAWPYLVATHFHMWNIVGYFKFYLRLTMYVMVSLVFKRMIILLSL